jgi:uncharacterized protein
MIRIRLTPNAAGDRIDGWQTAADGLEHLAARVRAVPEKGKANAALVALLAKTLGLAKRQVEVAKGSTSRIKTVCLHPGPAERAGLLKMLETYRDER